MKFQFLSVGKAHESYVKEGVEMFTKRIGNYFQADWNIVMLKNATGLGENDLKKKEGELILNFLNKEDHVVLLDEKGKQFSSEELANYIQGRGNESTKRIVFLIGGAYGVDDTIKARANKIWSLSKLVFPHQIVRLLLAEQVYRACTILKNEKYHHK